MYVIWHSVDANNNGYRPFLNNPNCVSTQQTELILAGGQVSTLRVQEFIPLAPTRTVGRCRFIACTAAELHLEPRPQALPPCPVLAVSPASVGLAPQVLACIIALSSRMQISSHWISLVNTASLFFLLRIEHIFHICTKSAKTMLLAFTSKLEKLPLFNSNN